MLVPNKELTTFDIMLYSNAQVFDSFIIALVALGLNLPQTYQFTNGIAQTLTGKMNPLYKPVGGPTLAGLVLHAAVLFLFVLIFTRSLDKRMSLLERQPIQILG